MVDDALPFCCLHVRVPRRPYPRLWNAAQAAPTEPKTIGDHLKRRRLALHLFQSDLAKLFGVDIMSIGNWENNSYDPSGANRKRIIAWFGYDPIHENKYPSLKGGKS